MNMKNSSPVIAGVLFSKDRAMQLEATLASFLENCEDPDLIQIHVIYTASSNLYFEQYRALIQEYQNGAQVVFHLQTEFKQDVLNVLGIFEQKQNQKIWSRLKSFLIRNTDFKPFRFLMFMVDDNIFVRTFKLSDALVVLDSERDVLGFSMQLGTNISYCYPLDIPLTFPAHQFVSQTCVKYRWVEAGDGLNYPLEVSSSIYRMADIKSLLLSRNYDNPNSLEAEMSVSSSQYKSKRPCLACYHQSVTFCNPANKVQNIYNNRSGADLEYTPENLAQLFSDGNRIDINMYKGFSPVSCHQEVKLFLKKAKGDK